MVGEGCRRVAAGHVVVVVLRRPTHHRSCRPPRGDIGHPAPDGRMTSRALTGVTKGDAAAGRDIQHDDAPNPPRRTTSLATLCTAQPLHGAVPLTAAKELHRPSWALRRRRTPT